MRPRNSAKVAPQRVDWKARRAADRLGLMTPSLIDCDAKANYIPGKMDVLGKKGYHTRTVTYATHYFKLMELVLGLYTFLCPLCRAERTL